MYYAMKENQQQLTRLLSPDAEIKVLSVENPIISVMCEGSFMIMSCTTVMRLQRAGQTPSK